MNQKPTCSLVCRLTVAVFLAVRAAVSADGPAPDYAQEILHDKPIAWWRFQDLSSGGGATVRDSVGHHDGVYGGGVNMEAGPARIGGKAARFDGKFGHVTVPDHPDFASETISVEFWFKSSQAWDKPQWPGSATIVTKATEGDGSGDWTVNAGSRRPGQNQGLVIASSGAQGGSDQNLYSSPGGLNDARWHHVVWTRSAQGALRLYIDGTRSDRGHDCGGTVINHRAIQIGGDPFLKGTFLAGCMAEVCIYDRVLEPARVAAHFAAGAEVAPAAPELVVPNPLEQLTLTNAWGLAWELQRYPAGWALGSLKLNGKPTAQPLTQGVIMLRNRATGEEQWLEATECKRIDWRTARFMGRHRVDEATLTYQMEVSLMDDCPAAKLLPRWSVDRDTPDWEVCLAWHDADLAEWRCTLYPWAGNATALSRERLTYCGVPSAILFHPDLSLVTLFGIAPDFDYLNPTTWTGDTGFCFADGATPPQFRVGGWQADDWCGLSTPLAAIPQQRGQLRRCDHRAGEELDQDKPLPGGAAARAFPPGGV